MPYQPKFTDIALTNLIGQIGSHPPAMARVAASQEMLNSIQLSKAAEKGGQSFVDAIDRQNTTRGFITGAIHRQSEIDGANADERIENWANAASIAVSAIPVPQAKAATPVAKAIMEFASSAAKGAAAEGAKNGVNAWGGNAQQQRVNNANAVDTSIATSQGVIHGGLFVSLVGASAVSGENWVTTLDSLGEAADALRVYHGAVR